MDRRQAYIPANFPDKTIKVGTDMRFGHLAVQLALDHEPRARVQTSCKKELTYPALFVYVRVMSHRNNASSTTQGSQFALVARLAGVVKRDVIKLDTHVASILVLVLVLLITNGGAG
jgi:hypothetical protein